MKLSAENIRRLEALVTAHENGDGAKAIVKDFGLSSAMQLSNFLSTLRRLGVSVPFGARGAFVSAAEKREFEAWRLSRGHNSTRLAAE